MAKRIPKLLSSTKSLDYTMIGWGLSDVQGGHLVQVPPPTILQPLFPYCFSALHYLTTAIDISQYQQNHNNFFLPIAD